MTQPDPTPDAAPAAGSDLPPLVLDFDALDAGDLEDMEDYCGQPIMPLLSAAARELGAEGAGDLSGLLGRLPARAITALLGVARRKADPDFGPERWRTVKLADLGRVEAARPPEPAPPTPIRGKRGRTGGTASSG